jgi:hypothetical protein
MTRSQCGVERKPDVSTHGHLCVFRVKQNDIVASHSASYATPDFCDRGYHDKTGTGGCEADDSTEPKPEAAPRCIGRHPTR